MKNQEGDDAVEALRKAEQRYRSIFEHAVVGIFQTAPDGHYLNANRALAQMYGFASPSALMAALTDIERQLYVAPGRRDEFIRLIREQEQVLNFESQVYRRDHSVIWISESARVVRDEVNGAVLYYEGMVQDVTGRKLAEQERDQANSRLCLQYAVTRTLASVQRLQEASGPIVQSICETVGWDMGALWQPDPETQELRCVDAWHSPTLRAARFLEETKRLTFRPGAGLPGRVWSSRKAFWIPEITAEMNFVRSDAAEEEGLHGAFAFPILHGGAAIGVMEFFSKGMYPPDDDLLSMLSALGSQIADFTERERISDELAAYLQKG